MAVYFFDSSAIVKRYVREAGTFWVLGITDPAASHHIYVARITGAEVVSALSRQGRSGHLSAADLATAMGQFRHDFARQYGYPFNAGQLKYDYRCPKMPECPSLAAAASRA